MRDEESDSGEVFGKASPGETFAWKVKAGSGDSGATSFWAVVRTKSPPDDDPSARGVRMQEKLSGGDLFRKCAHGDSSSEAASRPRGE